MARRLKQHVADSGVRCDGHRPATASPGVVRHGFGYPAPPAYWRERRHQAPKAQQHNDASDLGTEGSQRQRDHCPEDGSESTLHTEDGAYMCERPNSPIESA
jgi:hypothetical protein